MGSKVVMNFPEGYSAVALVLNITCLAVVAIVVIIVVVVVHLRYDLVIFSHCNALSTLRTIINVYHITTSW